MKLVYLSGGVGGARLLAGLTHALGHAIGDGSRKLESSPPDPARAVPGERARKPGELAHDPRPSTEFPSFRDSSPITAIVNVGDDFEHVGLTICPDIDSVLYTLSGLGDEARGWGLSNETFRALEMVRRYRPGDGWFQLGDQDLGTHLARRQWLAEGVSLTDVTARLSGALGVAARILPASDGPWQTFIETEQDGVLPFQEWLVRRRAAPLVRAVRFQGSGVASDAALTALAEAELIVIGPSNPYVSIDPILALPGMRAALAARAAKVPVVAVSPIVGGRAVKGPLAEMIPKLAARPASAAAIAAHYGALLHGIVVEHGDAAAIASELPGLEVVATQTVMTRRDERRILAEQVLAFGERLMQRSER